MAYKKRLLMTLLILFAVPICAGAALGYEMSGNSINKIPAVVMDHDHSEFSRAFTEFIKQSDIFAVTENTSSDSDLERRIFSGEAFVGIIIPDGFDKAARGGNAPDVMALYDGTSMLAAASAKAAMSEIVQTFRAGYALKLYESKLGLPEAEAMQLIRPIEPVYRFLYNPAKNYRNFFLPGLITAIIQVGIVIVGLERSKEEKAIFRRDLMKIAETGLVGLLSITVNMAIQVCFFDMPFRGSTVAFLLTTFEFSVCMAAFGYLFGKAIKDKVLSTQLACIFVIPAAILGGYTFPLMAMPAFFQGLSKVIPFAYYGEGLRALTVKELDVSDFASDILYYFVFLCVELALLYAIGAVKSRGERSVARA